MDGDKIRERGLAANALKQDAGGGETHLVQRLADGGEARVVKSGSLDVIEPDDGHIGGNLKAMVHQRPNRANGSDIVVTDERGKVAPALDEFVGRFKAEFGRRDTECQLNDQFRRHGQLEVAGHVHEAIPAIVGV